MSGQWLAAGDRGGTETGRGPAETDLSRAEELLREAEAVARELYGLSDFRLERLPGGRVNDSFLIEGPRERFVLQSLNDIFQGDEAPALNWHLVRLALARRSGLTEPPLPPIFPDRYGRWLASRPDRRGFWRLTGFVAGLTAPRSAQGAREAARLLGFLHHFLNCPLPLELKALPEGDFTNQRLTRPDDFADLKARYHGHPLLPDLEPLLDQAALAADRLPLFPGFLNVFNLHDLTIHGDPKADNFLFSPEGRALCLLDWDSVGPGHLLVDIAEMMRSWGLSGLSGPDPERLAAVLEGYAESGLSLNRDDPDLLAPVLRALALNLGRRYLTDALTQNYFQWDSRRYPSLYQQNRSKAEKLLALADYMLEHEPQLGEIFRKSYDSGLTRRREPPILQ
ncbi:MAG: phosphotransferase [Candidatus Adiutrix sp.]|jgi:hypothetical protein|nr:phosphotransferase [Candidatus Adiutrix sp.]